MLELTLQGEGERRWLRMALDVVESLVLMVVCWSSTIQLRGQTALLSAGMVEGQQTVGRLVVAGRVTCRRCRGGSCG